MRLDWNQIKEDLYQVRYGILFGLLGGFFGTAIAIGIEEISSLGHLTIGILFGTLFAFTAESTRRILIPDLKKRYTTGEEDDREY